MGLRNSFDLLKLLYSTNPKTFLLTYRLSQDHIETLFSAVRGKRDYDDNPTCLQFQAAYNRPLVHNGIVGSTCRDCGILNRTTITPVNKQTKEIMNDDNNLYNSVSHDHDLILIRINVQAHL